MTEGEIYSKAEIHEALEHAVLSTIEWVTAQDDTSFFHSNDSKWSTAEQVVHLTKSTKPFAMILSKPKFIMRLIVGKPNRPSRSYTGVAEKYELKLANQGVASSPFLPKITKAEQKKVLLDKYWQVSEKLLRIINRYSERDLDKYILPHPLLGKLTIREMLFFTIYHTQHHLKSIKTLYS